VIDHFLQVSLLRHARVERLLQSQDLYRHGRDTGERCTKLLSARGLRVADRPIRGTGNSIVGTSRGVSAGQLAMLCG